MISAWLYRNPRFLVLIVAVVVVTGLSSLYVLPRMEDPVLGKRVAVVTTAFPGADAQRVESQITEKIEDRLRDIAEIKEIRSTSRAGISNVVVELRDEITDVEPVWAHVRDRLSDAVVDLPSQATHPNLDRVELKAYAAILAVKWLRADEANLAILRRLALDFKLSLRGIAGTESVDLFGEPTEEIAVEIAPSVLAGLGLSTAAIAEQIRESDAKQPAGVLRGGDNQLLLDVTGDVDSLARLGQTRIRYGPRGETASLADIAALRKGTAQPPHSLALIDGKRSVVLGVHARDDYRIDQWSRRLERATEHFREQLPPGIGLEIVFSQTRYVENRLDHLLGSLLQGTLAVIAVVFLLMGWRSTIVVGLALPLSALMVIAGMRFLEIPIHQMSVTGLIIALGLLIDNAIVIVDEVRARIWMGLDREGAVIEGVRHLAMPLFGSTLTTTLAFAPIALLPGPPGEFVGTIALGVILAINASFLLAMTVVPALTALLPASTRKRNLFSYGLSSKVARRYYAWALGAIFRVPVFGVLLGAALPLIGYLQVGKLPEQFFPPADRDQIHIEIELSAGASLADTQQTADEVGRAVLQFPQVSRLHWFLGESAPPFFYNLVPRRRSTAFYGQAIVELRPDANSRDVIRELQSALDEQFAQCRVLVRQLEQGPPFDAPIEIQLRGPDLAILQQLGRELRLLLSQTADVIHTRSDLEESVLKLALDVDEQEGRLAGLSQNEIARQLYTTLEGAAGGSLVEGTEEIPIRVRLAGRQDVGWQRLAALELQSPARRGPIGTRSAVASRTTSEGGPPLSALARLELSSEVAAIPHLDGQRMNEVKAYVTAGVLPSKAIAEFERRRDASGFRLPDGYSMQYGGEAAERDEAVASLLSKAVVLFALMAVTLIAAFRSFRIALIIAAVGGLSMGLGSGALYVFGYPFGFMAIVGTMGLVGVAINDAIVVMAGIREDPAAASGDHASLIRVVVARTRHVVATTLTTMAGFTPLVLAGGGFWPPLAITIAAGVGGATLLALFFVPSLYLLLQSPLTVERESN